MRKLTKRAEILERKNISIINNRKQDARNKKKEYLVCEQSEFSAKDRNDQIGLSLPLPLAPVMC